MTVYDSLPWQVGAHVPPLVVWVNELMPGLRPVTSRNERDVDPCVTWHE